MKIRVNNDRVNEVSQLLKIIGPWAVLELEEKLDPQFKALKRLSTTVGRGWASVYALLVSLVSYRLAMKGEEWWECMATMISNKRSSDKHLSLHDVIEDTLWFLDNCRGSIIARDAKKKRILNVYKNAGNLLETLALNPEYVYVGADDIIKSISRALKVEEWRKTIVFTIKMIHYAVREPGERRLLQTEIPIPVDTRVACASYASQIIEAPNYQEIIRNPTPAQQAWSMISRNSGIPIINLDTILWLTGWAPRDLNLESARKKVKEILSNIVEESTAEEISYKLYIREC